MLPDRQDESLYCTANFAQLPPGIIVTHARRGVLHPVDSHTKVNAMKKILIALASVAALSATPMTFAQSSGANDLARTQEMISQLQTDQRAVMLDTLALKPDQLAKFTPIYDEYQAERKKLYTDATQLMNRLWVADYGGMTDEESKAIQRAAFKLRHDRLSLLEKYAGKLDDKLPATKVFQFVQVENKIQALLDVAAAASIPIVTKTPNTPK